MCFFSEYHIVSSANTPVVSYLQYIYFSDRVLRYFSDYMHKFTLYVRMNVCMFICMRAWVYVCMMYAKTRKFHVLVTWQ